VRIHPPREQERCCLNITATSCRLSGCPFPALELPASHDHRAEYIRLHLATNHAKTDSVQAGTHMCGWDKCLVVVERGGLAEHLLDAHL
jgi:hypothetical protein